MTDSEEEPAGQLDKGSSSGSDSREDDMSRSSPDVDSHANGNRTSQGEIERIADIVERRIEHLPVPDPEQAAQLREKAPELYYAYIEIAKDRAATDNFVRRAR